MNGYDDDSKCIVINSPMTDGLPSESLITSKPPPAIKTIETPKSLPMPAKLDASSKSLMDMKKYVVNEKPLVVRVKTEPKTKAAESPLDKVNCSTVPRKTKSMFSLINQKTSIKPHGTVDKPDPSNKLHDKVIKPGTAPTVKVITQHGKQKFQIMIGKEKLQNGPDCQKSPANNESSAGPTQYRKCKLPNGKVLLIPQTLFQKTNGLKMAISQKRPG